MHVQVSQSGGGRAISAASGRRRGDASRSLLFFQDRGGGSRAHVSQNNATLHCRKERWLSKRSRFTRGSLNGRE